MSKDIFNKGYRGYWNDERFRIVEIRQGVPNKLYIIRPLDSSGGQQAPIQGGFYREQLQRVRGDNDGLTG